MKTIAIPRVYLGTMSFGWSQNSRVVDQPIATEMVRRLIQFDEELGVACHYVDTARLYAGGKSETMLGVSLGQIEGTLPSDSKLMIGTKAHPAVLKDKGLSPDGIRAQLQASLDAMNLSSVDEFYLHQPDTERDLLESLRCTHSLVQEGKIRIVGMSNYHASEVARAFDLCKTHNLTPPTVYQGLYNPLNRMVEKELLPLLKENNCSFVAYNPLAAGLLTGKHTSVDEVAKGRFKNNKNYLERFYTPSNFEAIGLIQAQCEADGISMVEATYRWILRHSDLSAERDGVLLGASSLEQLDQNLEACKAAVDKDSLSPAMLEAFDKAWELTKVGAFPYWRSYSADMPGRESLDSGASYEAKK